MASTARSIGKRFWTSCRLPLSTAMALRSGSRAGCRWGAADGGCESSTLAARPLVTGSGCSSGDQRRQAGGVAAHAEQAVGGGDAHAHRGVVERGRERVHHRLVAALQDHQPGDRPEANRRIGVRQPAQQFGALPHPAPAQVGGVQDLLVVAALLPDQPRRAAGGAFVQLRLVDQAQVAVRDHPVVELPAHLVSLPRRARRRAPGRPRTRGRRRRRTAPRTVCAEPRSGVAGRPACRRAPAGPRHGCSRTSRSRSRTGSRAGAGRSCAGSGGGGHAPSVPARSGCRGGRGRSPRTGGARRRRCRRRRRTGRGGCACSPAPAGRSWSAWRRSGRGW